MNVLHQFLATWILILCWPLCAVAQQTANPAPQTPPQNGPPLVLAHYMPWYTAKPFSNHWGWHWTMNHFDPETEIAGKRKIASRYYPLIGPYDSGDPHVLEYHLLLMKLAGIDGVIVDWYGLTDYRDYATLHHNTTCMLQQCERLGMKFVICYEDQTIPALQAAGRIVDSGRVAHAVSEINWLSRYWFKSGNYVRFENKPLLLSFGHSGLTPAEWKQCLPQLSSPVSWFSQDVLREGASGAFGWPSPKAGMTQVDRFLMDARDWPASIPAAFPRFNDIYREAKVDAGFPQLPDDSGRTFQSTLQKANSIGPAIIQIATWNDWGEGTQIEPSFEFGYRDLEHLQSVTARSRKHGTATDLRLPLRILELRRRHTDSDSQQALDEISRQITAGSLESARKNLDKFR